MSDTYQAVYDAARSRIQGVDINQAVREAMDISHATYIIQQEFANAAIAQQEPAVLYRPEICIDGNQWCALYGKNLQDGVAGFGDSPAEAMQDFNKNWNASLAKLQAGFKA